jgi:hypothetical protein
MNVMMGIDSNKASHTAVPLAGMRTRSPASRWGNRAQLSTSDLTRGLSGPLRRQRWSHYDFSFRRQHTPPPGVEPSIEPSESDK